MIYSRLRSVVLFLFLLSSYKHLRVVAGVIVTLIGMLTLMVVSYGVSGQIGHEDYSIRMQKAEVAIDTCKNGTVISNHLTFHNGNADYKEIEVKINIGGSFNVEPSNFTVIVGPYGSESTQVNITAPPDAAFQLRDASVSSRVVKRNGIPQPGSSYYRTGFKALILQCAGVRIETSNLQVEGRNGDELVLSFTLWNEGNYYDDYLINVTGLPSSWEMASDNERIISNVAADHQVNFTIIIYPGTSESAILNISVTSIIEGERGDSDSIQVKIEIKRPWTYYLINGIAFTVMGSVALAYVARKQRRFAIDQEQSRQAYDMAMEVKRKAEYEAILADHDRWRP